MWTDIINFIKELFTGLLSQNTELKERTSNLFRIISLLYSEVVEKIKNNEYPYSVGTLLIILTENLYNTLKNYIPVKQQDYFFNLIREVKDPEKFYYNRDDNNVVEILNEISWDLKSLSEYLKNL
jgi:hypothetical protein